MWEHTVTEKKKHKSTGGKKMETLSNRVAPIAPGAAIASLGLGSAFRNNGHAAPTPAVTTEATPAPSTDPSPASEPTYYGDKSAYFDKKILYKEEVTIGPPKPGDPQPDYSVYAGEALVSNPGVVYTDSPVAMSTHTFTTNSYTSGPSAAVFGAKNFNKPGF